MLPFESKLPTFSKTIFTEIAEYANAYKAINLSQGFPDFGMDELLFDLAKKYMLKGFNSYAHSNGVLELRNEISKKTESVFNKQVSSENEVTITPGATYALFTIFTTVLNPNDEVIILEPAYDSYLTGILIQKAIPITVSLNDTFHIDWQAVEKKITPKTKLIIITNPHNPCGTILSLTDFEFLEYLSEKYPQVLFLFDEVYENMVFEPYKHLSAILFEKLWKKCFITYSFGKVFHCTGWRLGYVLAPQYLTQEFRKIHQFNVFSTTTPLQYAIAEYMQNPQTYFQLACFFEKKKNYFKNLLQGSQWKILPVEGGYFQLLQYDHISIENDKEFAIRLIKEAGVASIPLSPFYKDKMDKKILRFCFAKKDETLLLAAQKLCAFKK